MICYGILVQTSGSLDGRIFMYYYTQRKIDLFSWPTYNAGTNRNPQIRIGYRMRQQLFGKKLFEGARAPVSWVTPWPYTPKIHIYASQRPSKQASHGPPGHYQENRRVKYSGWLEQYLSNPFHWRISRDHQRCPRVACDPHYSCLARVRQFINNSPPAIDPPLKPPLSSSTPSRIP